MFDGVQFGQLLALVIDLQILEAAGRNHDLAFQRADELIVAGNRRVQRLADRGGVAAHDRQPLVELLAQPGDILGVLGLLLGAPAVGDRLAQGEQGGGRDDDYARGHGRGHQVRLVI